MRFINLDKRTGKYYVDLYLEQNRDFSNLYPNDIDDIFFDVEESV